MNLEALFQEIQTFLDENREISVEEYEQLLEEFYQVPSYVERFMRGEEEQ